MGETIYMESEMKQETSTWRHYVSFRLT